MFGFGIRNRQTAQKASGMISEIRGREELKNCSPDEEFTSAEAAIYLRVGTTTLDGYYQYQGLPRRNASPKKGRRGPFFYRKSDLDAFRKKSYEYLENKKQKPKKNNGIPPRDEFDWES